MICQTPEVLSDLCYQSGLAPFQMLGFFTAKLANSPQTTKPDESPTHAF